VIISVEIAPSTKQSIPDNLILPLTYRLSEARTDQVQTVIKRQVAATDKETDELVYELTDLRRRNGILLRVLDSNFCKGVRLAPKNI
jgi:hypothetical protein